MRKMFCCLAGLACLYNFCFCQTVDISYTTASSKQAYAARVLEQTFSKRGYAYKRSGAEYTINFLVDKKLGSEAFSIKPSANRITITGGDESGILYGSLSVAEDLLCNHSHPPATDIISKEAAAIHTLRYFWVLLISGTASF